MDSQKLLIHICCAPCLCEPLRILKKDGFEITGLWSNSNIHIYTEYQKRKMTLQEYSKGKLDIIEKEFEPKKWFKLIKDFSKDSRCKKCYEMRLKITAETAKKLGYAFFTSTLLYSIYQNHSEISRLGEELGREFEVKFLYKDFRTGWNEGILESKRLSLYRQKYCGCIFSEAERYNVS